MSHVSVIIPTYERAELLLTRSIPSVLAQTHTDWDLHVVGDGARPEVEAAMATVNDPRIKFTQRPRQDYPEQNPYWAWSCRGADAINYGLDTAQGPFVTTLGDDDEFMPNFMETLLTLIEENDLDMAYGRSEIVGYGFLGDGHPACGSQTNDMIWRLNGIRQDPHCYLRGLPNDWDLFSRIIQGGAKWLWTPTVVYRYYAANFIPGCSPT
jgi:glycosyltransferase involved in cell wall biosynthesis